MDYHLQNLATGETVKLNPEGAIIGTAEHAAVRTAEGGPYMAAFAVRYPGGWSIFGLSDGEGVTYNRRPLHAGMRVTPKKGDLLVVGEEKFTVLRPGSGADSPPPAATEPPEGCFAYVQYPDGKEECRALDHDLLFGRVDFCHVQLSDKRLSRLNALLAWHNGELFAHNLTKKVIGRNRKPVAGTALVEDGDELLIGPLTVRVEIRSQRDVSAQTPAPAGALGTPHADPLDLDLPMGGGFSTATDVGETTDDGSGESNSLPDVATIRENAQRFETWLKAQHPAPLEHKGGLSGWLESQRDRLKRFWYDTPETTNARNLRTAGRPEEAFTVLERAIRARPDSPNREVASAQRARAIHTSPYSPGES